MSKLLLDSEPLVIIPELATLIGLNESIVLQQIHYWIEINKKTNNNFKDNRYWTYNSYDEWKKQFPFWSISTIRRTIAALEKSGLLISGNYNKSKVDRTKWYTIDYIKLDGLQIEQKPKIKHVQNEQMQNINIVQDEHMQEINGVQNEQSNSSNGAVQEFNLNKPIPENNTETNSDSQSVNDGQTDLQKIFDLCHFEYFDEDIKSVFEGVIEAMYFDNDGVQIKGKVYPQEKVRERLQKITPEIIDHVLDNIRRVPPTSKNYIGYYAVVLFNAIAEYKAEAITFDPMRGH